MRARICQGICEFSFDQARANEHPYWYCDYTYQGCIHNDYQMAKPTCCYPINLYLVTEDEIHESDRVLLPNGTTKILTHNDIVDYLASSSNATKKVVGLVSMEIMREIMIGAVKIGDEIEI